LKQLEDAGIPYFTVSTAVNQQSQIIREGA
jgi:hypothetical protein